MQGPQSTETVGSGDVSPDQTDGLVPGSVLGERYEIRELLGRGGFALVYRAWDRELRRVVALKVLRADRLSIATLRRFRREAAVARDAASERLIRIFDIGQIGSSVFLILELAEGGSLDRELARGPLPVQEAIRIGIEILEGLHALHSLKIVHRDIKPGNVLLTAQSHVKLADFGLARHLESDETRATRQDALLGTFQYLAPEQALGQEADSRSDLYSFGVVFYEMLTGRLPYEGKSALGTLVRHIREEAPDVRAWRPDAPRWLAAVVRYLLAKNPEDRYVSAEAALADLRARALPRAARRKLVASTAAAALVLLLAGTAPTAWERWKAPRFSHLVHLGDLGVRAIGHDGRTLWTRPRTELYNMALARLKPGDDAQLVGILDALGSAEAAHTLSVLDPESGRELRRHRLPSGARSFPDFANTFHPTLWASDLDGDGGDEIVISYLHWPWWPSYTVLYEPKIDRGRVLFLGSGHHRFTGAHDLDGDERAELLLTGINNRMGWYTGIAAVKPSPWINDVSSRGLATASTPDAFYSSSSSRALLWYVLGPRERFVNEERPFKIDEVRRTLRFRYTGERELILGFHGFPADIPSSLPSSRREAARREAYDRLREAERLLQAGYTDQALAEAEVAHRSAETLGDPRLRDWIDRLRAKTLVFAGRLPEATAAFQDLVRTSEAAADIAYDAGKSFHLNGSLEQAASWYRLGLSRGGSADAGRAKWEHMEGVVLTLAELGRYEEGLAEIVSFVAAFSDLRDSGEVYRSYLRWKMGASVSPAGLPIDAWSPDLWRYWRLELRLMNGEEPRRVLRDIENELPRNSESDPQLLSLQGEALARLGQPEPAAHAAIEGYELAKRQRRENTGVHAHFSLIAERALRLSRAAGDEITAREAERELAQWRQRD